MNSEQRKAAFEYAQHKLNLYISAETCIDADMADGTGFDEVSDGVWVHAWIKVPKGYIPGYNMTPPAPAASIEVKTKEWPFPYKHPHLNINNQE